LQGLRLHLHLQLWLLLMLLQKHSHSRLQLLRRLLLLGGRLGLHNYVAAKALQDQWFCLLACMIDGLGCHQGPLLLLLVRGLVRHLQLW
jgi:hypothetical protein